MIILTMGQKEDILIEILNSSFFWTVKWKLPGGKFSGKVIFSQKLLSFFKNYSVS